MHEPVGKAKALLDIALAVPVGTSALRDIASG